MILDPGFSSGYNYRVMKRILVLFVVFAGLSWMGCSGSDEEPPDPVEYFNLHTGNWWTYDVQEGFSLDTATWKIDSITETYSETLRITEFDGNMYTWVRTPDNGDPPDTMKAFIQADSLMLAVVDTFTLPGSDTPVAVADTVAYAPCPLIVGQEWDNPEKLVLVADVDSDAVDDTVFYSMHGKTQLQETLSLPAGDFDSYRVLYEHRFRVISSAYGPMNITLFQRIWWSPNTGPVRWVDKDYSEAPEPWSAPDVVKNLKDYGGEQ